MMKKIKYVLMLAFTAALMSCSVENGKNTEIDDQKMPQMSEDVVEGQLLVRFDPRVSDILDKAGLTKSGPALPMDRSGVLSFLSTSVLRRLRVRKVFIFGMLSDSATNTRLPRSLRIFRSSAK